MDARIVIIVFVSITIGSNLRADERFEKPSIGVAIVDLPEPGAEDDRVLDLPTHKGVLVPFVWKGGPADNAGMKNLDIITAIAGKKVESVSDYVEAAKLLKCEKTPVAVYRGTATKDRFVWRRQVVRLTPIRYRDLVDLQVKRTVDEATGVVKYEHQDTPEYINSKSSIDTYVVEKNGERRFNMRITYVADEWIFVREYIFAIDNARFTITPPLGGVERDNNQRIWEWYVASVDPARKDSELMKLAKGLGSMKSAKVFYVGDKYRKEREITAEEQARILMMTDYLEIHSQ